MNKYFADAKSFGHANFSNYSGAGYSNLLQTGFSNADASMNAGVGESEPYNFTVVNGGTTKISNVVLLGAFQNTADGVSNFGNNADIDITMQNGDITYGVFLQSLKSTPFTVGQVYLFSDNSLQITNTLNIKYKDSTGKKTEIQIYPKLDPAQNLNNVLNQYKEFPVDGYTEITFDMLASATLRISLYRKMVIETANGLVGRAPAQMFSRPDLSQIRIS
jgi:hypothetical protein